MIKVINITPLNTSSELSYSCDKCSQSGFIKLDGIINTDDQGDPIEGLYNYECPNCGCNLKNSIIMHLESEPFNLINDGSKTIEIRLNDPKRNSLEIGDVIEFVNNKNNKKIKTEIIDQLRYSNFKDLLNSHSVTDFGRNNKDILLEDIRKIYSKENELTCGVLGIKIKVLK